MKKLSCTTLLENHNNVKCKKSSDNKNVKKLYTKKKYVFLHHIEIIYNLDNRTLTSSMISSEPA